MASLRIGLISDSYPAFGNFGGLGSYTSTVAEELGRLGHDVHVFSPTYTPVHRYHRINGVSVWECPHWGRRREMPILNAIEFTMRYKRDAMRLNRYSIAVAVSRAMGGRKFDVIESPEFMALGGVVRERRCARRFAVRLHAPIGLGHDVPTCGTPQTWKRLFEDERLLAESADVVTVPTDAARMRIGEYWGRPLDRARVIGNPVMVESTAQSRRPDSGLVFFGRLEKNKGVDTLVAALGGLKKRFPAIRATLVGRDCPWPEGGTTSEAIERIAARFGADGTYELSPALPRAALADVVSGARVCALPSRSETFGICFLEAMMWGVPTVASDIGAYRELANSEEHCLLVDPEDPDALAGGIGRLLDDERLSDGISRRARIHAMNWSPERIVPRLLEAWLS